EVDRRPRAGRGGPPSPAGARRGGPRAGGRPGLAERGSSRRDQGVGVPVVLGPRGGGEEARPVGGQVRVPRPEAYRDLVDHLERVTIQDADLSLDDGADVQSIAHGVDHDRAILETESLAGDQCTTVY